MPRPLVKAHLQTQCYGQLITAFPMALLGAGSDSNSKNPPKNVAVSELQPVILNITSVFSCYADSGQLTAYLFCSCLVLFALLAYLWLPFGKNHWEVPHWRHWEVQVVTILTMYFLSGFPPNFAVPTQNVRMMFLSQRHFPSVAELWYETSWFSHERRVNPWKCYFSNALFEKS